MHSWYPQNKQELNKVLGDFLRNPDPKLKNKEIHGLIVPHAGYEFSGAIAGKAFALLKGKVKGTIKKNKKVIVLGPSHAVGFYGIRALDKIQTPLGKVNILSNNFEKLNYEHSVDNQIPFLQKLNPDTSILPLVVGEITSDGAKEIAEYLIKQNAIYVFSTDLSHFLLYEEAIKIDKQTIKIIENLDFDNFNKIDACGSKPILIAMHLCKLKNWKLKLIEYKNSGDIIGDISRVVGYASFYF